MGKRPSMTSCTDWFYSMFCFFLFSLLYVRYVDLSLGSFSGTCDGDDTQARCDFTDGKVSTVWEVLRNPVVGKREERLK